MPTTESPARHPRVALVTLGCARNEVDSEELAGRLAADGFDLVVDAEDADAVLVNTCGFIEAAKRESVDALLDAAGARADGSERAVIAVGCMAERYGKDLAQELPEANAVLSFDDYPNIGERLRGILTGERPASHVPRDRRTLLPLAPTDRRTGVVHVPGHAPAEAPGGPAWLRRRLDSGPAAALKIASGCDRRCAFCAIPSFRGAFISRPIPELLGEARWLVQQGARELILVSENSTSYGKDLADAAALPRLLTDLSEIPDLHRIRVSYLQPAEVHPDLVAAMVATPRVANYFDLSFQHASPGLLRRMRRFGGTESFMELISRIRRVAPESGIRSNVIVGFPGESLEDVAELINFLTSAELDAVGVFGYSDEEGTEGAGLSGHLPPEEIRRRVDEIAAVADELMAQRAEARIGEFVDVLVEQTSASEVSGRAAHQGPEDGNTTVRMIGKSTPRSGEIVRARVLSTDGVDLHAEEVVNVNV